MRLGNFGSNKYIEYESNGDKINTLLIEQYLNEIRSYLKDIKNGLKKSYTQKIQSTIAINFVSHKETNEERVMH